MAMNTGRIRVHATETWNHDVPTASKFFNFVLTVYFSVLHKLNFLLNFNL